MPCSHPRRPVIMFCAVLCLAFISCEWFLDQQNTTPTKTRMEAVWEVTEAYNADGNDILDRVSFPIVLFHMSSDNTVISTAAPMFMYIVYGDSKFTEIASKIDQVFNYAGINFTGGEFFVGGGQQERFTLELKLEGLPGQQGLTTLLDMLGITKDYLDVVVYHKFRDVAVDFEDDGDTMLWSFDGVTTAVYNTKNNHGEYILWNGVPATHFSRCSFVLTKRVKDIKDLVEEATQ